MSQLTIGRRLAAVGRKTINGLAVVIFILMVAMVLAQVIARKFFDPLVWSEELARYLFIWVVFLGWFIATDRGSHIAISMFKARATGVFKLVLELFSDIGTLILMVWLVIYGCKLVQNNYDVETVTLFFSFAVVYAIVPVMALAIALLTLCRMWQRFTGSVQNVTEAITEASA